MEALRASYGDASSDSDADDLSPAVPVSGEKHESTISLPPPPLSLLDSIGSTCSLDLFSSTEAGVRVRNFPHVDGNYALHVYIPGNLAIEFEVVYWGKSSMVDAERRLLANALLEESNQRIVLLSDTCIQLFNFTTIYNYLTGTNLSFIGSFDDPSESGRGRYDPKMYPQINITDWRKRSQWFEATRELAIHIIADTVYYNIFDQYCKPPCYMDEHYIPTLVHMLHGEMSSNLSLTWVDWSRGGPHPARFIWPDVTDEFLNRIRFTEECVYYGRNGGNTTTFKCFLFARKFTDQTLEPLLKISPLVLDFGP